MCSFPGRNSAGENRATRNVKEDGLERGLQTEERSGALSPGHCEKEGQSGPRGNTCKGSQSNDITKQQKMKAIVLQG